jgi:hypothetical protein
MVLQAPIILQVLMVHLALKVLQAPVTLLLVPQTKEILNFISQGLFACFNVDRYNAQELHDHKKHVDEKLLKIEARQKEIMAKYDMPHSPLHAPMESPPPPTFYNPWEEMGGPSMMFGAPQVDEDELEEDLGGREASDED